MNLEDELPRLFDELANDHTVGSPHADRDGDVFEAVLARRRSPFFAPIAVAAALVAVGVGGLFVLRTGGTDSDRLVPAVSNTLSGVEPSASTLDSDLAALPETSVPIPDLESTIADAVGLDELYIPPWFANRKMVPSCGTWVGETAGQSNDSASLECFSSAIANDDRAQIVTIHSGDDLRVARWISSLGTGPFEADQFAVDSLVVDERAGTTRWFETRCVEGYFVDGRLVGDFIVGRDQLDDLDPSGTTVTDNGDVVELPGPDDRMQLQPCNGPVDVDRPVVTPFEATGLGIGDNGSSEVRLPGFNEVGEYDLTVVPSWIPVGDADGVIGFIHTDALDPLPPPQADSSNTSSVIYADDGTTRVGQFGPDGRPTLDN